VVRGCILVDHYNFIHSFLRWVATVTIIPLFSARYVLRHSGTVAMVTGYFVCAASNGLRVTRPRTGRSALEFLPISEIFISYETSRPALGRIQPPFKLVPDLFPGHKAAGA